MNLIQEFTFEDWDSQWAGNWPILAFSYWGPFYSRENFSEYVDRYVHHTIIIRREGKSMAYQRISEKAAFSEKLIAKIGTNENLLAEVCQKLKEKTDIVLGLIDKWIGKDISFEDYKIYQNAILAYYPYHVKTKVLVDYLSPELLKKYLPLLREARIYAEPVFSRAIEFINVLSAVHAEKTGYNKEMIGAMTKEEFEKYLVSGTLPSKEVLDQRDKGCAFLFLEGKTFLMQDVNTVDEIVTKKDLLNDEIKGQTAYSGKAKGFVKIIMDPNTTKSFHQGEILIAGMTRPEYVPFMEKAAAFVTDGGGILCHAAIVAREMQKPCVVGTQVATKAFKDGDLVEVDAEKGIIKKIKKIPISS